MQNKLDLVHKSKAFHYVPIIRFLQLGAVEIVRYERFNHVTLISVAVDLQEDIDLFAYLLYQMMKGACEEDLHILYSSIIIPYTGTGERMIF